MKTLRPERLLSLLSLLAAFVAGAPTAPAQDLHAEAEVYTRVYDDVVQVAIEIAIDDDWHLYHKEFADKNAIGMPTTITLDAEDITWSSLHYPKPEVHVQKGLGGSGPDPKIEQHHGTITIFAAGKADDAATIEKAAEDLLVSIRGLTCEDGDGGYCVPYNEEELEVAGNGDPTLWKGFPVMLMSELGVSFTAPTMMAATPAKAVPAAEQKTAQTSGPPGSSGGQSFQDRFGSELGGFKPKTSKAEATLYSRIEGDQAKAVIVVDIQDHWHLYHDKVGPSDAVGVPTTAKLNGRNVEWDFIHFPEPVRYEQKGLGAPDPSTGKNSDTWIWGHEGEFLIYAKGTVKGDAGTISAELNGQTCEDGDGGTCVLWSANPRSKGPGEDSLFANFPTADDRPWLDDPKDPIEKVDLVSEPEAEGGKEELSFLAFLLLAVGGGLITLLMPCTYPMIPITISFFTKQADTRDGKVLPLSITYGIGIIAIFVLIGVVVGPIILRFAAHPVTNLVIGIMFIAFALSLFGMFNLQPPAFLMNAAGQASMKGGYVGVFLMGATLVITSFTCTAPFVGSLLAAGATGEESNVLRVAAGMGVFGATVAIPFVFLSLLPGKVKSMPQSGQWMNVLKVTLGFVELAAALKFLSNSDLAWNWGVISKEFFLVMWLGIFFAAAMFLFGWIDLKGEAGGKVGPGRMVAGIAFLLLGLYCGLGVLGAKLDWLMSSFAPPYSSFAGATHLPGGAGGEPAEKPRVIIEDDYEAAVALALAEKKKLLVNFTGQT